MVNNCCVPKCKNNSKNNRNIKFFRLPNDVMRRFRWLDLIGRLDLMDRKWKSKRICSDHFTTKMYAGMSGTKLKQTAEPIVCPDSADGRMDANYACNTHVIISYKTEKTTTEMKLELTDPLALNDAQNTDSILVPSYVVADETYPYNTLLIVPNKDEKSTPEINLDIADPLLLNNAPNPSDIVIPSSYVVSDQSYSYNTLVIVPNKDEKSMSEIEFDLKDLLSLNNVPDRSNTPSYDSIIPTSEIEESMPLVNLEQERLEPIAKVPTLTNDLQPSICRTCLTKLNPGEYLELCSNKHFYKDRPLYKVFQELTQTLTNAHELLPTSICFKCAEKLQHAVAFKRTIEQSDKLLWSNIRLAAEKCHLKSEETVDSIFNYLYGELQKLNDDYTDFVVLTKQIGVETNRCENSAIIKEIVQANGNETLIEESQQDKVVFLDTIDNVSLTLQSLIMQKAVTEAVSNLDVSKSNTNIDQDSLKEITLICQYCEEEVSEEKLKKHFTTRHKILWQAEYRRRRKLRFQCDICKKGHSDKIKLKKHKKVQHETKHSCNHCEINFTKKKDMELHLIHAHGIKKKIALKGLQQPQHETKYSCAHCESKFMRKQDMYLHLIDAHAMKVHKLCHICGRMVPGYTLSHHIRSHAVTKSIKCPVPGCSVLLKYHKNLNTHIKRCHQNEKPYVCDRCGKAYAFPEKLRAHLRDHKIKVHLGTHRNEKSYNCPVCPQVFARKSSITKHCITYHPEHTTTSQNANMAVNDQNLLIPKKKFKCKLCKHSKFAQKYNLIKHTRTSHPAIYHNIQQMQSFIKECQIDDP